MQIHHLRNATLILTLGERRLLVDPMLSAPGALPGFKVLGGGRRRNPLVPLPAGAEAAPRAELRRRIDAEGLTARVHVPADGEALHFERRASPLRPRPQPRPHREPGFQKWLTAKLG